MRRGLAVVILFLSFMILKSQEKDTSGLIKYELEEIAVSATRTKNRTVELPAQIDIINASEIEGYPLLNIDDILRTSSNLNVNRSWGIFSKNSSVTMRGLEGSARVLVLVDGVPKNKLGGGSVNWHNINPATIERIEVIKGPSSSVYGNNAMGGVINIISKKPVKKFAGEAEAFAGSYGTKGGLLNLSGSEEGGTGFYWNLNGYYRKSDGYIFEPPEYLDETDVPTYLKEFGGGGRAGYRFSEQSSLEVTYDYYDELRGAGRQVYMEGGSFGSYKTKQVRSRYRGKLSGGDLNAILYFNNESYYGQNESLNDYDEYKLLDSYTDKLDYGFWTTWSKQLFKNNLVTIGLEGKSGSLDGEDIYRTSPDQIDFSSRMNILGLFIQDEVDLYQDKLKLIAGLRADYVKFFDGFQRVQEPSKVTGFQESFQDYLDPNSWLAFSPKLSLQYNLNTRSNIYASYSVGFMPPGLKDLGQTGKIRKGFRLANPDLKPEYLANYELGYKALLGEKVSISGAVYYSRGRDFHYMVSTGDSIDTGGSSLKPVMTPDNIARIGILGGEVSAAWYISNNVKLNTGYSYNHSRIREYSYQGMHPDQSLVGNFLAEVSPHLFYGNLSVKSRFIDININSSYVSEQWYDDENTIRIDDYFLLNLKLSKSIKSKFIIYTDVQNILDMEFVDRKGQLSPGRFIIFGLIYRY